MGGLIRRVGSMKVGLNAEESVFEALTSSIIYQQRHGKAAATILARFRKLFRTRGGAFPSPMQVVKAAPELLRTAGLSGSKAASILDLATKVLDRTAQRVLLFTFGRTNIWPTRDFGVRRGYELLHGMKRMPTAKELEKLGKKYEAFGSAAAWYCWRATEQARWKKVKLK